MQLTIPPPPGWAELRQSIRRWSDLYTHRDSVELVGYVVILGLMLMWGTLLSIASMGAFEKGVYVGAVWFGLMGTCLILAAFYGAFGAWWGYNRIP